MTYGGSNKNETKLKTHRTSSPWRSVSVSSASLLNVMCVTC